MFYWKNSPYFVILLALLFSGCVSTKYSHRAFGPGVSSETLTTDSGQQVHIATVDRRHAQLIIASAHPKKRLEKPSQIAKRHQAIVAVNASFFAHDGKPVGALKVDGKWLQYPSKLRGVVGFNEQGPLVFDRLLNKQGLSHEAEGGFAPDSWWEHTNYILGGAPLLLSHGQRVDPRPEQTRHDFLEERYARTAICSCSETLVKLVVVEGGDRAVNRFLGARGMNISELQTFLLSIGCQNALNLDGGYSSAFVWRGEKLNRFRMPLPERKVSTVLIVQSRDLAKKGGEPIHGDKRTLPKVSKCRSTGH